MDMELFPLNTELLINAAKKGGVAFDSAFKNEIARINLISETIGELEDLLQTHETVLCDISSCDCRGFISSLVQDLEIVYLLIDWPFYQLKIERVIEFLHIVTACNRLKYHIYGQNDFILSPESFPLHLESVSMGEMIPSKQSILFKDLMALL
jgi:hypothetical protein